jgi:hypothetical protein
VDALNNKKWKKCHTLQFRNLKSKMKGYLDLIWMLIASNSNSGTANSSSSGNNIDQKIHESGRNSSSWEREVGSCSSIDGHTSCDDSTTSGPIHELNPTPTPLPTFCPENIDLVGMKGATTPPELPIEIVEQNTKYVTFRVKNPFSKIEKMYIQFDEITDQKYEYLSGDSHCHSREDVEHEEVHEYTAYCSPSNPISIINIWYSDPISLEPSVDSFQPPKLCHPDPDDHNNKVQYAFMLHCVDACQPKDANVNADADSRRLLRRRER